MDRILIGPCVGLFGLCVICDFVTSSSNSSFSCCDFDRLAEISSTMASASKNVRQCNATIRSRTRGKRTRKASTLMAPPASKRVPSICSRTTVLVSAFAHPRRRPSTESVSSATDRVQRHARASTLSTLETSRALETVPSLKGPSPF